MLKKFRRGYWEEAAQVAQQLRGIVVTSAEGVLQQAKLLSCVEGAVEPGCGHAPVGGGDKQGRQYNRRGSRGGKSYNQTVYLYFLKKAIILPPLLQKTSPYQPLMTTPVEPL